MGRPYLIKEERGFDAIYAEVRSFTNQRFLGTALIPASFAAKAETFTGTVSDAMCGAKHMMAGDAAACLRACVRKARSTRWWSGTRFTRWIPKTNPARHARQAGRPAGQGERRSRWRHHRSQLSSGCQVGRFLVPYEAETQSGVPPKFFAPGTNFHIACTFAVLNLTLIHTQRRKMNWAKTWSPRGYFLRRGSESIANVSLLLSWRCVTPASPPRIWFGSHPSSRHIAS